MMHGQQNMKYKKLIFLLRSVRRTWKHTVGRCSAWGYIHHPLRLKRISWI